MKNSAQLLKISAVTIIIVLAAGSAWAADAVRAVQKAQASKQSLPVQPQIKAFQPESSTQRSAISVPAAPAGLTAVSPDGTKVILTWKDMSSNEQNFEIERKTGSGNFGYWSNIAPNTTTIMDSTVLLNATYTYRMRAYNAMGNSPYSNEATVTVKLPATANEIIQCPEIKGDLIGKIEPAPAGWTAQNTGFNAKFVPANNEPATIFNGSLMCTYSVGIGTVTVYRSFPTGKTCKEVNRKYFLCE